MKKLAAIAAFVAAACAMPANAALYLFQVSLYDNGGNVVHDAGGKLFVDYDFKIDSDPTPDDFSSDPGFPYFTINNVAITHYTLNDPATVTNADNLTFWDGFIGGAFSNADYSLNYFGLPLYSGQVDRPTFERGLYDLYVSDIDDPAGKIVGTLSISAAPEPASWIAMTGGFALCGFALRRKRRAAIA